MPLKRKRRSSENEALDKDYDDTSSSSTSEEQEKRNGNTPMNAEGAADNKPTLIAENLFETKVLPYNPEIKPPSSTSTSTSKRSRKWSSILVQHPLAAGGPRCNYQIAPEDKWLDMKKYNKFVVADKGFGIGDYVYIYHGDEIASKYIEPTARLNWVAQVLEIRAVDSTQVYLRVFWLYWPEELPTGGRQPYHGSQELVASNYMAIVDAMTVTDRADVQHLKETSSAAMDSLYWRQTYDVLWEKLSNLQRECYCNNYFNPDKLLIQCSQCESNLHEACLLRDACSRAWQQEQEGEQLSEADQQLQRETTGTPSLQGTIPDSQPANGRPNSHPSNLNSLPPPPPPLSNLTKSSKYVPKRRKSPSVPNPDPWEDQMRAKLEMKEQHGEAAPEATGIAIVTYDPIDKASQTLRIGLRCLMPKCGKWMHDEAESQESVALVKQEANGS